MSCFQADSNLSGKSSGTQEAFYQSKPKFTNQLQSDPQFHFGVLYYPPIPILPLHSEGKRIWLCARPPLMSTSSKLPVLALSVHNCSHSPGLFHWHRWCPDFMCSFTAQDSPSNRSSRTLCPYNLRSHTECSAAWIPGTGRPAYSPQLLSINLDPK